MDSETYDLSIQLQNVTMGSTQLKRFSFFPKLPIEIRINIWRLYLGYVKRYSLDAAAGEESPITPNPTLLKVNRESRNETLRSLVPLQRFYRGGIKYFNPALDTIRFWGSSGSLTFLADDLIIEHGKWCAGKHQIKRLEIKGVEVISNNLINHYQRRQAVRKVDGRMLGRHFRGLETITVLSNGWSRRGRQGGVVRSDDFTIRGMLKVFHDAVSHEFRLVREKEFPECKIPQLIIQGWPLNKYE